MIFHQNNLIWFFVIQDMARFKHFVLNGNVLIYRNALHFGELRLLNFECIALIVKTVKCLRLFRYDWSIHNCMKNFSGFRKIRIFEVKQIVKFQQYFDNMVFKFKAKKNVGARAYLLYNPKCIQDDADHNKCYYSPDINILKAMRFLQKASTTHKSSSNYFLFMKYFFYILDRDIRIYVFCIDLKLIFFIFLSKFPTLSVFLNASYQFLHRYFEWMLSIVYDLPGIGDEYAHYKEIIALSSNNRT